MSDKRRMYYVGFCRICGTGPLGLRECGGCGEVVVLCDECDAVWMNCGPQGDFPAQPHLAKEGELPCPHCETSLIDKPSRWAHKKTIDVTPWLQAAVKAGTLEVKRGSALSPEIDEERLADGP